MKTNPPKGITMKVSMTLLLLGVIALCGGWFVVASILGCAAAANLIAGNLLKKY
jgi:hypothetical protein